MKDTLNEQLSACLDGELPQAELDLLLKRVGKEAELRAAIGRYSLIGEAMRAERPAVASRGFADRVMAAVAKEGPIEAVAPLPAPPSRRPAETAAARNVAPARVSYLRPAFGMAIAAGVAAIAVLTLQPVGQPELAGSEGQQLVAANESTMAAVDAETSYVVPTSTSNSAFIPATRLTNYVVAHSEYSSPLGRRSVLSGVLADDEEIGGAGGVGYDRADDPANDAANDAAHDVRDDLDAPVQISIGDGAAER